MTYAAIYTAATEPAFQGRCLVAAWQAAQHEASRCADLYAAAMDAR